MVLHVRKRELLCLPSFAAYSCLVTHDRGGATELKQDMKGRQYWSDSVSNEMNGKRDSLHVLCYPLQSPTYRKS